MMAMAASNSNDLFISHEMEELKGRAGATFELDHWCSRCLWYIVSHIGIIQEFDEFYIGGV
jgi:hypothetical protein